MPGAAGTTVWWPKLGGPEIPAIGFACGMERLALLMAERPPQTDDVRPDFYIACLDERAPDVAVAAAETLRSKGLGREIFAAKGPQGPDAPGLRPERPALPA